MGFNVDPAGAISAGLSMATSMGLGIRIDPALAHSFMVEIDGLITGGFASVDGLDVQVAIEPIPEGGQNQFVEQRVTAAKPQRNLVLKRGLTSVDMLWAWVQDVAQGNIQRRSGSIVLMTKNLAELWRWNFVDAYPVHWTGPQFKADQATVAFESIELVHRGLSSAFGLSGGIAAGAIASVGGAISGSISGGISL